MPSPPDNQDKAARRARRRWLAKRRCQRALRATITFIAIFTPFLFFGLVLCCRMPFGLGDSLPNWILLYECWMFLRNTYILARYVWITPLWAALPFVLNMYFIAAYPHAPYGPIRDNLYFSLFKQERMHVIRMIWSKELYSKDKTLHLPQPYTYLARQNGLVSYMTNGGHISVLFSASWNVLSLDESLLYVSDDTPKPWLVMHRVRDMDKIENHWYVLYPEFGYFRAILNWPMEFVPEKQPPPPPPPSQQNNNTRQQLKLEKFLRSFDRQ